MFKLSAEQKTISIFMGDNNNLFLIPDYQRPYSWEEDECIKLWEDILSFAFPENDCDKFKGDSYFLGTLVLFRNENRQLEVIDGQQRLITITLLLRAFYEAYGEIMTDETSSYARREIAKCMWVFSSLGGQIDMSKLKIHSDSASDDDHEEFLSIMLTGNADKSSKGKYAQNYKLFQKKIKEFQEQYPKYFSLMPERILQNCLMLPIETDGQDTALRIFSTMNDRGRPLSDSDIFKARLYKAYSDKGEKDLFISRWKDFEYTCGQIIVAGKSNPIDDIFMRYMHYARASKGIKDTTVEGLRDFYGRDDKDFSLLRRDYARTFENLVLLADFWKDITALDGIRFSEDVRKSLFVLHYAPNNMWTFLVSVYFMTNNSDNGTLDNRQFHSFLQKITGFILASRIMRPGNTTPFFNAMVDIASGREVSFTDYEFNIHELRTHMQSFDFNDSRKITRGIIAWHVFQDKEQEVLSLDSKFDTEHIYPRARMKHEAEIAPENFDSLGNKSLLEKSINIRASDYRFSDKVRYYHGLISGKKPTKIHELQEIAKTNKDFTERDIILRTEKIIDKFIDFIRENNLAQ